ncbi:MAG: hypothetical protein LRS49_05570 [Desulfurococcales archaeon]|nr:hypothetical protein [Desulfurococcales archaeon]
MPPRVTLAWSRCSICGRHAPTWRCKLPSGGYAEACLFCIHTLRLPCRSIGAPPRGAQAGQAAPSLEPDEALLETITSGRSRRRSKGASTARRSAGRHRRGSR